MRRILSLYVPLALFLGVSIWMVMWDAPLNLLKDLLSGMNAVSYVAYVLILTSAVVFMPLTVMPLIPIAASVIGPFMTALLSIVGWTLGGAIAFLISRHLGRPVLEKIVNLEKMDALAQSIPGETHFWFIVLLRLTLPVDLVSYALGLAKSLSFTNYIVATAVGVTWFSFAFAYLGDAFFKGNSVVFMELALASVFVFSVGWYILHRKKK